VSVTSYISSIAKIVERQRLAAVERDKRMAAVTHVLSNRAAMVFRDMFPSDWPEPIVANTIKSAVSDAAFQIGVLPTLRAAGDSTLDESKRSRSDKLTRIIGHLAYASNLGTEMVFAAMQYQVYGFVPFRTEPNYDDGRAHIGIDSCLGTYYTKNRFEVVTGYSRVMRMRTSDLVAMFPERERQIRANSDWFGPYGSDVDEILDVVRYTDSEATTMYLPRRDNLVLEMVENRLGRVPVRIADQRTMDGEQRGEMDDALWVYAAKARLALLTLEAATKAVEAPIAVPTDMEQFEFGPDAIIRTNNPQAVRRVALDVPNGSMFELSQLDTELKLATHYPDVRAGQTDASVVTGRGVQALMGGFDQRVKGAQVQLGSTLADALSDALEMEKVYFGSTPKKVYASVNGTAYELSYTPEKDIYSTHVSAEYGVMAGLDPNRALVWSLQALGAGLVSETFVRHNLPVNINPGEEEKLIDVEGLRKATMVAVQGYAQSIPELAVQGQDPLEVIGRIGTLIEERKKGVPIEEAAAKAFKPKEPTPEEQAAAQAAQQEAANMAGPAMPGMPGGMPPGGQPPNVQMPQQPPSQQQLLAQLNGNGENRLSARTVRQATI
jgi:hypothetical protein